MIPTPGTRRGPEIMRCWTARATSHATARDAANTSTTTRATSVTPLSVPPMRRGRTNGSLSCMSLGSTVPTSPKSPNVATSSRSTSAYGARSVMAGRGRRRDPGRGTALPALSNAAPSPSAAPSAGPRTPASSPAAHWRSRRCRGARSAPPPACRSQPRGGTAPPPPPTRATRRRCVGSARSTRYEHQPSRGPFLDAGQHDLAAGLPPGERAPPHGGLPVHLVFDPADLEPVGRQHVSAGRHVQRHPGGDRDAARADLLARLPRRHPAPGDVDAFLGVADRVAERVPPARRPPNPHDRLPVRKDHESTSYSGPSPVSSAPHEQYAAPNASEHSGECCSAVPGAGSTLNASCEPVRHSACSASTSDGRRLEPDRCRVSVDMVNGPAVCCWNDPAPASVHRFTAPGRISFAAAGCPSEGGGSVESRHGATRLALAFAPATISATRSLDLMSSGRSSTAMISAMSPSYSSSVSRTAIRSALRPSAGSLSAPSRPA